MAESTTKYSNRAINWITQEKSNIESVANTLGASKTAIAGFMAKECTDFDLNHPVVNPLQDSLITSIATDENIWSSYLRVRELGIGNDKPSTIDKMKYYSLNDVGLANIKIQTGIDMLYKYEAMYPDSDPLNLKGYLNLNGSSSNLGQFARDLASDAPGLAAKISGLLAINAVDFYSSHNAVGFQQLAKVQKDGLIITNMTNGPKTSEENYQENIMLEGHYGSYIPGQGPGDSGGQQFVNNSSQVADVFEMDAPTYNNYTSGNKAGIAPSNAAAPDPLNSGRTSTALIDYVETDVAVLKKGGTLSDIVAIENSNGNNITVEDLRLVNGLTPDMDSKLQIGQRIAVPRKNSGQLVVDDEGVHMSFNPVDGTSSYEVIKPESNTTITCTRVLDSATGLYTDQYVERNSTTGSIINSFNNAVDSSYGVNFDNGQPRTNLFLLTNTMPTDTTQQGATDQQLINSYLANNNLFYNGITSIFSNTNGENTSVNTDRGAPALANFMMTGGYMPGNNNTGNVGNLNYFTVDPSLILNPQYNAAQANTASTWLAYNLAPTDPLVLDLNGDGVKLTDYGNDGVLFDADHDGGSLEQTGWVSPQDGIVVMDVNANGRIDDISETLSEYFGGTVGTGGSAGTKPYRDGKNWMDTNGASEDAIWTMAA